MLPIAGDYIAPVVNNSLPNATPGDDARLTLAADLPLAMQDIIANNDVYAKLGCGSTTEWVKVKKGSYNSSSNTVTIVRGASSFANGAFTDTVCFDGDVSLSLDFSCVHPASLANCCGDDECGATLSQELNDIFYNSTRVQTLTTLMAWLDDEEKLQRLNDFLNS